MQKKTVYLDLVYLEEYIPCSFDCVNIYYLLLWKEGVAWDIDHMSNLSIQVSEEHINFILLQCSKTEIWTPHIKHKMNRILTCALQVIKSLNCDIFINCVYATNRSKHVEF